MSIKECAADMKCSEQFLRIMLQQGRYPFGDAVKQSSIYTYYINEERYKAWKEGRL